METQASKSVRPPAVAGFFYPQQPDVLRRDVVALFERAQSDAIGPSPKAVIVPHAGYVYSGPLAARALARFAPDAKAIERIVLIGPAHRVALRGIAVPTASAFATPLGNVEIDGAAVDLLSDFPFVVSNDAAHAEEHSLEVQLPLLQRLLPAFRLVPLVVGDASAAQVGAVLGKLWGGDETRIVISSDLSHFHPDAAARVIDAETAHAIEAFDSGPISYEHACGRIPIAGLLQIARERKLAVERIGLCNSGDTAGPKASVVGYGAWAFHESQ